MMNYLYGLLEGLLEGLFGLLPLSSSGHRLLLERLLSLPPSRSLFLFAKMGALLGVLLACRKTLQQMAMGLKTAKEKRKKGIYRRKKAPKEGILLGFLSVACIPMAAAAVVRLFYDYTEVVGQNLLWAGIGFLLSAGLLFIGDHSLCQNWEAEEMKGGQAFKLGLFRAIGGIFPGFSPIGITTAMGMNMGFAPQFAAEFAILLSIPALLGSILWQILTEEGFGEFFLAPSLIAFGVAAVFGYLSVLLLRYAVKKERFGLFLYYCLAAGIGCLIINGI